MTYLWLTKLRRYDGSSSVVGGHMTVEDAQRQADDRNAQYQSDRYYAEAYNPFMEGVW